MEKNDDYKRGYREGFLDGFHAARDNPSLMSPNIPIPQKQCPQCGRSFVDSLGRLIPMGVVCAHVGCPNGGPTTLNVSTSY
jgi:hypothetical protein